MKLYVVEVMRTVEVWASSKEEAELLAERSMDVEADVSSREASLGEIKNLAKALPEFCPTSRTSDMKTFKEIYEGVVKESCSPDSDPS